jgi:hypothetical protein
MRPHRKKYTLAAASAAGFCSAVTGNISVTPWTTIAGAPGDGCAHETQLVLASGGSLAGVTLTITGTDAEGRVQTEAIAGPSATTTLAYYYKTITSILSSATLGASTMNVGWTALCRTPAYPVTVYVHGAANLGVTIASGSANYTAQQTSDDVFTHTDAKWYNFGTVGSSEDQMLEAADGAMAVRLDISSHTSGVIYANHSQARQ